MHEQDQMANDKLAEGIEGFSKAIVALEQMLETASPSSRATSASTAPPRTCSASTTSTETA